MRRTRQAFLLGSVLTILFLASSGPPAFSVSYTPGVRVGDSAMYSVYESWENNISIVQEPPNIARLKGATNMSLEVTLVNGEFVDILQTWKFNNGSDPRTNLLWGDIFQGTGKISGWLISKGLSVGDSIYSGPGNPTINRNSSALYAGKLHSVNIWTVPSSDRYLDGQLVLHGQQFDVWDRDTGLVLEGSSNETGHYGNTYAHGVSQIKITQLNTPRAPQPAFPFFGLLPNQLYTFIGIIATIALATMFLVIRRYRRYEGAFRQGTRQPNKIPKAKPRFARSTGTDGYAGKRIVILVQFSRRETDSA